MTFSVSQSPVVFHPLGLTVECFHLRGEWRSGGKPLSLTMFEMKDFEVSSNGKLVGTVKAPVFDSKNPSQGVQDILGYDWKSVGYASAEEAVVTLVNTQHATNLRNKLRSDANPKLTQEKIANLATVRMATLPLAEVQALAAGGPEAILARIESIKQEIIAEHKAKVAAAAAEASVETPSATTDEE